MQLLDVASLSVHYEGFDLSGVSLSIDEGEIIGFVGRNGAGKSTTINAIMGFTTRQGGTVKYCGKLVDETNLHLFKQDVGYVGEVNDYYPNIAADKVATLLSKVYRNWDKSTFNHFAHDVFHIDTKKKMIDLSSGTRVKLSLAFALSHDSKLLLLDEPTSGLDPVVREEVLHLLYSQAKEHNRSIFFSSHITQDIAKIADRVSYLVDGKILLNEKKEKILSSYCKLNIDRVPEKHVRAIKDVAIACNGAYVAKISDLPGEIDIPIDAVFPLLLEDVLFYLNGGIQ